MCEQCVVIPYYYGEVFPGVQLIRSRRETKTSDMELYDWGLLFINNPFVVFKTTPVVPKNEDDKKVVEIFDKFVDEFLANIEYETVFKLYETYRTDYLNECNIYHESKEDITGTIFDDIPLKMTFEKNMAYIYMKIAKFILESTPTFDEEDPLNMNNDVDGVKIDLDYDPKKE